MLSHSLLLRNKLTPNAVVEMSNSKLARLTILKMYASVTVLTVHTFNTIFTFPAVPGILPAAISASKSSFDEGFCLGSLWFLRGLPFWALGAFGAFGAFAGELRFCVEPARLPPWPLLFFLRPPLPPPFPPPPLLPPPPHPGFVGFILQRMFEPNVG